MILFGVCLGGFVGSKNIGKCRYKEDINHFAWFVVAVVCKVIEVRETMLGDQ